MHKRKLAAKAEREKDANTLVNIAAQAFNGFKSPDASSAVNTPLPTPSPSPILGPVQSPSVSAAAIQNAFAKAAAASRRPVDLVLNRRRQKNVESEVTSNIPDIHIPSAKKQPSFATAKGATPTNASTESLLQVPSDQTDTKGVSSGFKPNATSAAERRRSGEQGRSYANPYASGTSTPRDPRHSPSIRPFTAPVRPDGATDQSKEPFLAIRSAAEGTDRARRLVADAVRKMWFGAPESWRRQFEEEARLMELRQQHPGGNQIPSDEDKADDVDEIVGDDLDASTRNDQMVETSATTRGERARAALRRGVLRAVKRAIDGDGSVGANDVSVSDDEVTPLSLDHTHEQQEAASANSAATQRLAESLLNLSRRTFTLPPDLTGDEYEVRPLDVEKRQGNGERTKRFVAKLRRKMEVRNRDVVVWD